MSIQEARFARGRTTQATQLSGILHGVDDNVNNETFVARIYMVNDTLWHVGPSNPVRFGISHK